jgi:hypothetical protein
MAEETEHLPSKCKVLSSNPSTVPDNNNNNNIQPRGLSQTKIQLVEIIKKGKKEERFPPHTH